MGSMAAEAISSPAVADGVTILGATGALGFGLAVRLGRAGVPVVIGSRDAGRAEEAAAKARDKVGGATFEGRANEEAAQAHEVVFLCVPFRNQSENLTNLRPVLREGQLLVDATVPLAAAVSGKATRTVGVWQGSAAEQAQEMAPPGVTVVSALHTVSAATLQDLDHRLDEDVLVCGRRRDDKRRVARIVERIEGLRCVDAGPLEQARIVEPLTAMLIGINGRYKTHAGIRITGLPGGDLFPPLPPKSA
jgi:8-hydroxy-5-deazaflavin:NADPH oxidoreductase